MESACSLLIPLLSISGQQTFHEEERAMEICSMLLCGLLISSSVLSSAADGKHIRFQQFNSLLREALNSLMSLREQALVQLISSSTNTANIVYKLFFRFQVSLSVPLVNCSGMRLILYFVIADKRAFKL